MEIITEANEKQLKCTVIKYPAGPYIIITEWFEMHDECAIYYMPMHVTHT